jgi:hypothetical protein
MSKTIINGNGIIFDSGSDGFARIHREHDGTLTLTSGFDILRPDAGGMCTLSGVGPPSEYHHATNMQYVDLCITSVNGVANHIQERVADSEVHIQELFGEVETLRSPLALLGDELVAFSDGSGKANIDTLTCRDLKATNDVIIEGHLVAKSMTSTSDKRLKERIEPLSRDRAIHILRQLKPVTYKWRESGIDDIGFIAQEVQMIVPEFVHTSEDGMLSMDYGKITSVLLAAWQHADSNPALD